MLSSTSVEQLDSPLLLLSSSPEEQMTQEELMWMNPTVKYFVYQGLNIPVAADKLPFPLSIVGVNGKLALVGLLAAYLILLILWLPFWLLSFVITESGIYALFVGTVFFVGRIIIR